MKKKFIDLLKSKHTHVGVSDKALDRVASFYEKNGLLKEESTDEELSNLAEGAEPLLIGFKAESDSKLEDFKKKNNPKQKTETEKKVETPETETKTQEKEEMPAWAKAVIESNQNIAKELAGIKSSNTAQSRKQIFEQSLKDVPEKLKVNKLKDFERMQFEDDDAFNNYVTETVSDLKDFVQTNNEQQLGASGSPLVPGGGKLGDNEVSPMMKAFITNRAKTTEASQHAKAV